MSQDQCIQVQGLIQEIEDFPPLQKNVLKQQSDNCCSKKWFQMCTLAVKTLVIGTVFPGRWGATDGFLLFSKNPVQISMELAILQTCNVKGVRACGRVYVISTLRYLLIASIKFSYISEKGPNR